MSMNKIYVSNSEEIKNYLKEKCKIPIKSDTEELLTISLEIPETFREDKEKDKEITLSFNKKEIEDVDLKKVMKCQEVLYEGIHFESNYEIPIIAHSDTKDDYEFFKKKSIHLKKIKQKKGYSYA